MDVDAGARGVTQQAPRAARVVQVDVGDEDVRDRRGVAADRADGVEQRGQGAPGAALHHGEPVVAAVQQVGGDLAGEPVPVQVDAVHAGRFFEEHQVRSGGIG
jgi:hypothetical protein